MPFDKSLLIVPIGSYDLRLYQLSLCKLSPEEQAVIALFLTKSNSPNRHQQIVLKILLKGLKMHWGMS